MITTQNVAGGPLRVTYNCESSSSFNQACLHVEVAPLNGTSPSERNLEIVFYADSYASREKTSIAYHLPVRLPEGAGSVRASLPFFIPRNLAWDIEVLENGRDIELSRTLIDANAGIVKTPPRANDERAYHLLRRGNPQGTLLRLVKDDVNPTRLQSELIRLLSAQGTLPVGSVISAATVSPGIFEAFSDADKICRVRSLPSAPEQWQYYLQFKLVALDRPAFEHLQAEYPAVADALKTYVASGGRFLLIGDHERTGRRAVDQWLSATDQPTNEHKLGWHGVQSTEFAWWNRDANFASARGLSAQQLDQFYPMPGGLPPQPGMNVVPQRLPNGSTYGPAPRPRSDVLSPFLRVEPIGDQVLSLGGCIRDLIVALETVGEAKFGAHSVVPFEFADVLMQDPNQGMFTASSSVYGVAALAIEPLTIEYQGWKKNFLTSWDGDQYQGCQTRNYVLGHVAVVEPGLNSYPVDVLRQLLYSSPGAAPESVSSAEDGTWAFRNMIPSVGKPPVWTFCAIVLLFGLVLGPGCLVATAWLRRRSLLIFFIPVISLVATLLIVAYEVLHEGFETRIRVTSVLALDERSNEGFAWSRQTYYSGWPPREGLNIPEHLYFRPIAPLSTVRSVRVQNPRDASDSDVDVKESELQWTGWLRAREQQQLLIGHSAKVALPLKVIPSGNPNKIRLKNLTDEQLPFALVRDEGDGYYLAEDVIAGAEVECVRQTLTDVGGVVARHRAEYLPSLPEGLNGFGVFGRGRFAPTASTDMGSIEVIDCFWNTYLSEKVGMPPGAFATLVQNSDAVTVPLKGIQTDSKHLVVGRLVW